MLRTAGHVLRAEDYFERDRVNEIRDDRISGALIYRLEIKITRPPEGSETIFPGDLLDLETRKRVLSAWLPAA